MRQGYHPPTEQYLAAIYEIGEHAEVIQARIVEKIGHSAPTVSETVRLLEKSNYIVRSRRGLILTDEGRRIAESVLRKHRLAEVLLFEFIGLDLEKIHDEACKWEHVMSDEVEEKLNRKFGSPATCPHGNSIPGNTSK